jgi:hypothetical protein
MLRNSGPVRKQLKLPVVHTVGPLLMASPEREKKGPIASMFCTGKER